MTPDANENPLKNYLDNTTTSAQIDKPNKSVATNDLQACHYNRCPAIITCHKEAREIKTTETKKAIVFQYHLL